MKYYLTPNVVFVENGPNFSRQEFEKWLIEWNPFDFPEVCSEDLLTKFWEGKIKFRQPEFEIETFIDYKLGPVELDKIKSGLDRIVKEVMRLEIQKN